MAIPQKVGLRRSNVAGKIPTSDQIELGELAFNTNDKKIYFKGDDGSIIDITSTLDGKPVEIVNLQDGEVLQYNSTSGKFENVSLETVTLNLTTDDVQEAGNLYYTDSRARSSISVSGDLSYNSTTGVVSFNETYSTPAEIKTAYESNTNTNAYTDSEKSKLSGIESGAEVNVGTNLGSSGTGATRTITSSTGTNTSISYNASDLGLGNVRNVSSYSQPEADSNFLGITAQASDSDKLDGQDGAYYLNWNNFTDVPTYDNYSAWTISDGTNSESVASGQTLTIEGSGATTAVYDPVSNTLTINSVDTNTNTTYSAGIGLSLSGTTFSLSDERYTTSEKNKLSGIESGATGDQTASEILTAIKTVDGSTSGLDADLLDGNHASAFALSGHTHNYDNYGGWTLNTDGVSRGTISSNETLRFNGGSNVSLSYSSINNAITINSTDTNTTYSGGTGISLSGTTFNLSDERYTSSEKTKLSGIESGATADQTASEIKTAYESNTNTNAYTDGEKSKLSGIEAGAEVNVATNLGSSGTGASRTITSSTGANTTITYSASDVGAAPSSHTHTLSQITDSGDLAAINTNANTSNYLRGDGAWATPPGAVYNAGTGISLSGTTFNVDNPFNPSGNYSGLRAQATTASDVGLGNVRNVASYSQTESDGRYVNDTGDSLTGSYTVNTTNDGTNSVQVSGGTRTDTLAAGSVQNAQESIDTDGNVQVRNEGQVKMGEFAMQYNSVTKSLDFNWIGA